MRQLTQCWKLFGLGLILAVGLLAGPGRQRLEQWGYERTKPAELPAAESQPERPDEPGGQTVSSPASESDAEPIQKQVENSPATSYQLPATSIPAELNLAVPFTSQAPHAVWDVRHEEYCEEASVLMVGRYFAGRGIEGPDDAEAAMNELEAWQVEHFGFYESTTADETKQLIKAVYDLDVTIVKDVTTEAIKRALAEGGLIIVPAAGRELGNPYFQRPGPIYHMLVVKGYTADGRFITNDPGTRRGADFVYAEDKLLSAIGDYNHGDPANGESVVLVVKRR